MFSKLLVAVSIALAASASPLAIRSSPVTIQLARRFNTTGSKNIIELDQARAKFLKNGGSAKFKTASASSAPSVPVTNGAVTYTAEVQVGSPPTTFSLIVDTGSSNTWIGASTPFTETSTSHDTGAQVAVEYGSGLFFGEEFLDQVSLGSGLTVVNQSIGVAEETFGFTGVDGILGIGPTDLTEDTTSAGGMVPTILDNAFGLGMVATKEIGISFKPTTNFSDKNGELTFGGVDTTKFTGPLTTVPITSTSPASDYVGIDQTITYGSFPGRTILSPTAGIVDTGTTLLLLPTDSIAAYMEVTGAVMDDRTGLLSLSPTQFSNLKSMFFEIGDNVFEFTPDAQLWPRELNTAVGGEDSGIYLIVGDLGTPTGEGLDFINGFAWLERHYFVFDSGANTASFATTEFTHAIANNV
ncbi:aspartic peptidase A1 [Phanerochaete sordida]|uniref:Aspartic peptidase A1 n=1 Tax=Phanerochaete sordida TaxID=48140 RepID=A0A9P3GP93_9APHY|nr:aspartic peptidase A1 [Phanerochaete sordida]